MGVSSNWLGCVSDKDTMKDHNLLCPQPDEVLVITWVTESL